MTAATRPAACNIGPAELARRRRSATWATALAIVAVGALIAIGAPPLARLAFLPLAVATAVTWLQVIRRFCVAFGAAGIRNFGSLGSVDRIENAAERSADRRVAMRMILEGVLYGAVATAILVILPV